MEALETFYRFMTGYAEFLGQMATTEEQKHRSVISYDVDDMDQAISNQQAMLMRLENMEKQRVQALDAAGFSGLRFREILDRLEGADQERFTELFQSIEKTIDHIRFYNEKSMEAAKINLQTLSSLNLDSASGKGNYSAEGKRTDGGGSSLFEAKI